MSKKETTKQETVTTTTAQNLTSKDHFDKLARRFEAGVEMKNSDGHYVGTVKPEVLEEILKENGATIETLEKARLVIAEVEKSAWTGTARIAKELETNNPDFKDVQIDWSLNQGQAISSAYMKTDDPKYNVGVKTQFTTDHGAYAKEAQSYIDEVFGYTDSK